MPTLPSRAPGPERVVVGSGALTTPSVSTSATDSGLFAPRTPLLIAIIGIAAFAGWLVLSAFGADFRSGRDGGAHGLSVSGTGYAGLVTLVHAARPDAYVSRDRDDVIAAGLAVLTPGVGQSKYDDLATIIRKRGSRPTLLILPKWQTAEDPLHPGWVMQTGTIYPGLLKPMLSAASSYVLLEIAETPSGKRSVLTTPNNGPPSPGFPAPQLTRVLVQPRVIPIIANADGGSVLGRVGHSLYVLADPDLVANHSLGDLNSARRAVQLITALAPPGGSIAFDVTLNGFGEQHSLAQLALKPPFLGLTLCLAAAALLAGWGAITRFGTPPLPPRALAFGKRALIDNAAALVRIAKRQPAAAARYIETTIDDAAARARLAVTRDRAELIRRLDARRSNSPPFAELAAAATAATSPAGALAAAADLYRWKEDVTREFG